MWIDGQIDKWIDIIIKPRCAIRKIECIFLINVFSFSTIFVLRIEAYTYIFGRPGRLTVLSAECSLKNVNFHIFFVICVYKNILFLVLSSVIRRKMLVCSVIFGFELIRL